MADVPVTGPFRLVYLVWNTLFISIRSRGRDDRRYRGLRDHHADSSRPGHPAHHQQYVTLSGRPVGLLPVAHRYCWPSELDLMAQLAGLRLRERYSDWTRTGFDASSRAHVSVYELI